MKMIHTTLIGSLAILIAGTAAAADKPDAPERLGRPRMNPEMRAKILEQFDKDGDGTLNAEERKAASNELHPMMHRRPGGPGADPGGPGKGDAKGKARRGGRGKGDAKGKAKQGGGPGA